MTKDELFASLSSFIALEDLGITLYAQLKNGNEHYIKRLDIEANDLPELLTLFKKSIEESILKQEDLSILALSSSDERKNAIYEYDVDLPVELMALNVGALHDLIEPFNFESDDITKIGAMLIKIGNEQRQMFLYKAVAPINIFSRKHFLLKKKSRTRLERNQDDLIRVSAGFHLIKVDDVLFVTDLEVVEKLFGFHEIIKRAAVTSIEAIKAINLVENIDVLVEATENVSFSRKLLKVAKGSTVLQLGIPNTIIIGFCENFPALKGKIRFNSDKSKILLDTKVSQDLLIKVLLDNFLVSELTNIHYESLAKDQVATVSESNE